MARIPDHTGPSLGRGSLLRYPAPPLKRCCAMWDGHRPASRLASDGSFQRRLLFCRLSLKNDGRGKRTRPFGAWRMCFCRAWTGWGKPCACRTRTASPD